MFEGLKGKGQTQEPPGTQETCSLGIYRREVIVNQTPAGRKGESKVKQLPPSNGRGGAQRTQYQILLFRASFLTPLSIYLYRFTRVDAGGPRLRNEVTVTDQTLVQGGQLVMVTGAGDNLLSWNSTLFQRSEVTCLWRNENMEKN